MDTVLDHSQDIFQMLLPHVSFCFHVVHEISELTNLENGSKSNGTILHPIDVHVK